MKKHAIILSVLCLLLAALALPAFAAPAPNSAPNASLEQGLTQGVKGLPGACA